MDFEGIYGFQHLPTAKFAGFEKKTTREKLEKWCMLEGLRAHAFSFSKPFKPYLDEDFIKEFFACPAVFSSLEVAIGGGRFSTLGTPAETVKFSTIKCTQTTMELFDKLVEGEAVVRKSGSLVPCSPVYVDPSRYQEDTSSEDFEISDNLRKVVIASQIPQHYWDDLEVDDNIFGSLTPEDTKEFLFKIFSHLVIGGTLCQYEDAIHPYLETAKILYKDLVSVSSSEEERLQVNSVVYKIHEVSNSLEGLSGSGDINVKRNLLFHKKKINNFLYLIVNPLKQTCFTFYHQA